MGIKQALFLSLAALVLAGGALWWQHRPMPPPKEATYEEVTAEAQAGGYCLITTEELGRLYLKETPGLLLVDTRQEWEYRSGHLRGAVNFPMEPTWWGRWRAEGPLTQLLGADKDRLIVFY
ncbi:MAG: rhodanese-like domain-containing protein [Deltaproteobacteria bacterium]|nr:rhodanese-like domain-containing protein [Deltaproteobacteria bacterium]